MTKFKATTKPAISSNGVLAEVNYSATDTWLEPYIGHKFEVVKRSKNYVWFLMDNGGKKKDVEKYEIRVFDFC